MAKLTTNEIEALTIVRATLEGGKWVVLTTDESHYIYRVSFDGLESDDDALILSNTHTALADVDKYESPVIVQPITRDCICGENPTL